MSKNEIKLIIIDDHPLIVESFKSIFQDKENNDNINIVACGYSGKDAFELAKSTVFDVMLLDIEMKEMDGVEALEKIIQINPLAKIIMVSLYDNKDIIKFLFAKGASAYITKGTLMKDYVSIIKAVSNKGFYFKNHPEILKAFTNGINNLKKELLFTNRELETVNLLCKGKTINEIAEQLFVSNETIETRLTGIYKKTGVKGCKEFLIFAIDNGFQFLKPLH